MSLSAGARLGPYEIVGVIGSVRHRGFGSDVRPEMILPYRQLQFGSMTIVVRSELPATSMAAAIPRAVHSIDGEQPVYRISTMDELFSE